MKPILVSSNPSLETTDWKAVCGRTARTVWREGGLNSISPPYPYRLPLTLTRHFRYNHSPSFHPYRGRDVAANTIANFIARWAASAGAERANYQLFLTQLCELLAGPQPQPTKSCSATIRFQL